MIPALFHSQSSYCIIAGLVISSRKYVSHHSLLSDYLNMQARLGKASVANTLLMIAQKPKALSIIHNYFNMHRPVDGIKYNR